MVGSSRHGLTSATPSASKNLPVFLSLLSAVSRLSFEFLQGVSVKRRPSGKRPGVSQKRPTIGNVFVRADSQVWERGRKCAREGAPAPQAITITSTRAGPVFERRQPVLVSALQFPQAYRFASFLRFAHSSLFRISFRLRRIGFGRWALDVGRWTLDVELQHEQRGRARGRARSSNPFHPSNPRHPRLFPLSAERAIRL
jgi:hypothetical protein